MIKQSSKIFVSINDPGNLFSLNTNTQEHLLGTGKKHPVDETIVPISRCHQELNCRNSTSLIIVHIQLQCCTGGDVKIEQRTVRDQPHACRSWLSEFFLPQEEWRRNQYEWHGWSPSAITLSPHQLSADPDQLWVTLQLGKVVQVDKKFYIFFEIVHHHLMEIVQGLVWWN